MFSWNGKTYKTYYSVGATEYQDESPWEYEEGVECIEVILIDRVVQDYVPIEEAETNSNVPDSI